MELFTLPKMKTASIKEFKEKMTASAKELKDVNLKMVAGTPPWFMYLLKEMDIQHDLRKDFLNLDLIVYGGSNIGTYRNHIDKLFGKELFYFETFAATEGFIGYQYYKDKNDLLLNIDGDIFYEFILLEDYLAGKKDIRFPLWEIEKNQRYVPYITNISGLYSYFLGDIFEFTETSPYLFKYIGRTKHVIAGNYEVDFTSPIYSYIKNKDCFFTEFCFSSFDDNVYFILEERDSGLHNQVFEQAEKIKPLLNLEVIIKVVKPESFYRLMEKNHKIGGQFKISKVDPSGSVFEHFKEQGLISL
jgi:hypothetical protein